MAEAHFRALRRELLAAGIGARHVARLIEELEHHRQDLLRAELARGTEQHEAEKRARALLGSDALIVGLAGAVPALLCWSARWPALGRVASPLRSLVLVPLVPLAGIAAVSGALARWALAALLGGLVTVTTLFLLQLSLAHG